MPTNEYWAGFFDGEGHVSIALNGSVNTGLSQKRREVLDLAQNQFGGTVHMKDRKFNHCFTWKLMGVDRVSKFWNAIYPHLIVKKKELEIGMETLDLVRRVNKGCVPLTSDERKKRFELREKLIRERASFKTHKSTSKEEAYRLSIKELFDYKCSVCGKDLSEADLFDQIVSEGKLLCRSCHRKRFNLVIKPVSKEQIIEAIRTSKNLDEASQKLGLVRSSLLQKRKKYGLVLSFCDNCEKVFEPTPKLRHYCTNECAEEGKQRKRSLRDIAYRETKRQHDKQYYLRNRERILKNFASRLTEGGGDS